MADCYIYYRIAAMHEQAARGALSAILAGLEASAGIVGRVYRQTHEPLLWMEVYTAVADPDALVGLLTRLADEHGLSACLAENQRRHVECFEPLRTR